MKTSWRLHASFPLFMDFFSIAWHYQSELEQQKKKYATKQMFHSMHVMICILTSRTDPKAAEIDSHIKVFLSCCHRFSRSHYDKIQVPFWASPGNFLTLLCIAAQRYHHGPMRWYWEGTSEIVIQQLKKFLISMRKTTEYFSTKLVLMHKTAVLDWLSKHFVDPEKNETERHGKMYNQ